MRFTIWLLLSLWFPLSAFAQRKIDVEYEKDKKGNYQFEYKKDLPGSYCLSVEFTKLFNASRPKRFYEIKKGRGRLLTLKRINPKNGIDFRYSTSYSRGIPIDHVDDDVVYLLPFQEGKSVSINEAYNIEEKYFEKDKTKDWKSYVFWMEEPESIFSSRKGIVVKIESDHDVDSTQEKAYTSETNKIIVEHKDGSYASYSGFHKDSIAVELGQTVYPRTKLGVLQEYNKDQYRLDLKFYHRYHLAVGKNKKPDDYCSNTQYRYITPIFLTDQGAIKVKDNHEYKVMVDHAYIVKEMKKKERKKFKAKGMEYLNKM